MSTDRTKLPPSIKVVSKDVKYQFEDDEMRLFLFKLRDQYGFCSHLNSTSTSLSAYEKETAE